MKLDKNIDFYQTSDRQYLKLPPFCEASSTISSLECNVMMTDQSTTTNPAIHPTAIIDPQSTLEEGVTVGPYCVIEGDVHIGANTTVLAHSILKGSTSIGANCRIGPHAAVGTDPQHRTFDGRPSCLVIEDNVMIREFATVHRSTESGIENATYVGRGSLLMVGSHVAHDCRLGKNVTLANSAHLGGHVVVGDNAFIGGGTVIHQFVRIGRLAIVAGGEALTKDVMPFGAVFHHRHKGYNAIGCRRAGLDARTIHALRSAFLEILSHRNAITAVHDAGIGALAKDFPQVKELIDFVEHSRRGITPSQASAAFSVAS